MINLGDWRKTELICNSVMSCWKIKANVHFESSVGPQFSAGSRIWAEPGNLPFAMKFSCFCRILWNRIKWPMMQVVTFWHSFSDRLTKVAAIAKACITSPVIAVDVRLSFSSPVSSVPEPINWKFKGLLFCFYYELTADFLVIWDWYIRPDKFGIVTHRMTV